MSGVTMPNETPHKGQLGRWPALDGLRALAVVLVMFNHLDLSGIFGGGSIGVDIFFVLSGFLITTLLIGEFRENEQDQVWRVLRSTCLDCFQRSPPSLWSRYFWSPSFTSCTCSKTRLSTTLPFVIFFVGNWARVFDFNALGVLAHTWSLGIEEQFYLVWPLLFVLLAARRRRGAVALVLTGIAGLVIMYRFVCSAWARPRGRSTSGPIPTAMGY